MKLDTSDTIPIPDELQAILDERDQAAREIARQHKFLEDNYSPKLAQDTPAAAL